VTLTKEAAGTSVESQTLTGYDALGRKTSEQTGYQDSFNTGQTTVWTYDLGGRTTKTDDEFTCTTATYDYRDLHLTETQGQPTGTCSAGTNTRTVTNTYDGLGRIIESKATAGAGQNDILAAPTYDSAGNQRSGVAPLSWKVGG
jgi:YD repeat-containing protein